MFQYFKKRKQLGLTCLLLPILVVFLLFLFPQVARAGAVSDLVFKVFGALLWPVIWVLSKLLLLTIRLITVVAVYNDFINSPVVTKGWTIIRDLANMFFLVMMLVIAFGTVLKIEQYSYKRHLATLLIMAVLVNFSRMICGLIIDLGQVVMLTFMSVIKGVAETNFANMLGLNEVLTLSPATEDISILGAIGTVFYALILVIISLVVCLVFLVILVFRIVMLWILVAISPIAFIGQVLPGMQQYARQWWQKFTHQVIVGPVLAFFLWLTLAVGQVTTTGENLPITEHFKQGLPLEQQQELTSGVGKRVGGVAGGGGELTASLSKMGTADRLMGFAITIAMLIGGLMAAQQLGVAGSQMAGKAMSKIQAYASGAAKFPWKGIAKPAVTSLAERLSAATGVPLLPSMWKEGWKEARRRRKEERLTKMRAKGLAFGSPEDFAYQHFTWKGAFGIKAAWGTAKLKRLEAGIEKGKITAKEMTDKLSPKQKEMWEKTQETRKEAEQIKQLEEQKKKTGKISFLSTEDKFSQELAGTALKELEEKLKIVPEADKEKIKTQIEEIKKMLADKTIKTISIKADWQEFGQAVENQLAERKTIVEEQLKDLGAKVKADEALSGLDQHLQKMEKYREGAKEWRHLKPLAARVATANLIAEEERKFAQIEEPQELNKYLDDAFKAKDKVRVMAIMKKMTRDANDNEFLNYYKYSSDMDGMHKFFNEKMVKELGMNKQEAYEFETDLGYINEKIGHWETARMGVVDEITGAVRQATEKEHVAMANIEMKKRGARDIGRNSNRLAYGGEIEAILPDGTTQRIFHLTESGIKALRDFAGGFVENMYEYNVNAAQVLADLEAREGALTKNGIHPVLIKALQKRARGEATRGMVIRSKEDIDPKTKQKIGEKIREWLESEEGQKATLEEKRDHITDEGVDYREFLEPQT